MFSLDEYLAVRDAAGLIDRSDRAKIAVSGRDRAAWLQGLLTNDVAALGPGQGCYAAHLTPQGRMVTDMRVVETGELIVMDFERPLRDAILARFDQFIFAEDVRLEDLSAARALLGVHGPLAADLLSRVLGENGRFAAQLVSLPEHHHFSVLADGVDVRVVASRDFGERGFDLLLDAVASDRMRDRLRGAGALDVGPEAAEAARIETGRPRFGIDMDGETIPLEAGIEDRAISLTKGCYVGQEVVIRILHRGHGRVARRLVGLVVENVNAESHTPAAEDRISAAGKEIGRVTSGALSPRVGRAIALGYVHRDFTAPQTHVVVTTDGHPLPAVVSGLPFRAAT